MRNLKTITIFFLIISFWSCDPLKDEIDEVNENFAYSRDIEYTLTSDDYDISDEICNCSGFGNFSSEDDAKLYIPAILSENFPALQKGSSAIVTYDIYNGSSPDLNGTYSEVTVTVEEYLELGFTYKNFNNADVDVVKYANWKFPDARDGDYADITFDYYDGSFHGGAVSRVVYTVAYGWQYVWPLPDEAYALFGESSSCLDVPDFSYKDEAFDVLHLYLNEFKTFLVDEGEILAVQYNYDNGDDCSDVDPIVDPTEQNVALYIFSGGEWILYNDQFQTTAQTLSFGNDGAAWVPDNTIKYALASEDYAAIAAAFADSNPAGSGSASSYGNFDLTLWTSDQIFKAITDRLLDIPEIIKEEGQKYLVTYATWEPGAGSGTIHVIYKGGVFVKVDS